MTMQPELQPATEYSVPEIYSRGYGQPLQDVRGEGYFFGVGALSAGFVALGLTVFALGMGGLSVIPGIMAIYLGVLTLKKAKKPAPTAFSSKATQMGIWGMVCGILAVLMTLGGAVLLFFLESALFSYSAQF